MLARTNVFITGPNGGIGLETVKILVQEDVSKIALACRTLEKAEWTKSELLKQNQVNIRLEPYGGFDMGDEKAIKTAVAKIPQGTRFDIVFLQAGGMIVADNFQFISAKHMQIEKTIYQNVMGAYLTLMHLDQSGLIAPNARIVFPGGEGARGIKGMIKKPTFQSVDELENYIFKGFGKYKDLDALGYAKFMTGLLVQQLAELDKARTYIWFSPGLTSGTKGLRDVPNPKRFLFEKIGFPLMNLLGIAQSPKQAAQKYVDCLDGKYGESGDLLGAPEGKTLGNLVDQKPMNAGLTNFQFKQRLWEIVVKCCGTVTTEKIKG